MSQSDLNVTGPRRPPGGVSSSSPAEGAGKTGAANQTGPGLAFDTSISAGGPQFAVAAAGGGPALAAPLPLNPVELMTILYALQQKSTEERINDAESQIQDRKQDKQAHHDEMIKKLEKVAHKSKGGAIAAKVFAWIGVALSFVIAAVVTVVSGGTAGAAMFALAAVGLGLMIAQETGLMDKMTDAMGMDEKGKMAFSIGLAVVMLVANIGAMVASGGASAVTSLFKAGTEIATEVAAEGAEAAATATEVAAETTATATEVAADSAEAATEIASETATATTELATETATETTEATSELAETGAEAGKQAAQAGKSLNILDRIRASGPLMTAAQRLHGVLTVGSGAAQVGGGVATVDDASEQYSATKARADALTQKAELAKLLAFDEENERKIRKLMEQLQNSTSLIMSTITDADKTAVKIRTSI